MFAYFRYILVVLYIPGVQYLQNMKTIVPKVFVRWSDQVVATIYVPLLYYNYLARSSLN